MAASASATAAAAALLHPPSLLRISLPPTTTKHFPTFPTPRPRCSRVRASYRGGSAPESTECPVPLEQQPVNEYQSLSTSLPFSWASGDLRGYCSRLAFTGASFALFVGLPVASFGRGQLLSASGAEVEAARCAIGAVSTGLLAVTLAVLRMYLGWAYVGNRLLSATVEYEETGWYDGQIWIKTPEVLARDRLLGSFEVKPVLNRVKVTLVGLAASLVACAILFISLDSPKESSSIDSNDRVIAGVYSQSSAELFEPDVFHSDPSLIMKVVD